MSKSAIPTIENHPEYAAACERLAEVQQRLAAATVKLDASRQAFVGVKADAKSGDDIDRVIAGEDPIGPDPARSAREQLQEAKRAVDLLELAVKRCREERSRVAGVASVWLRGELEAINRQHVQKFIGELGRAVEAATALDQFVAAVEAENPHDLNTAAAMPWVGWWPAVLTRLSKNRSGAAIAEVRRVFAEHGPGGLDLEPLD